MGKRIKGVSGDTRQLVEFAAESGWRCDISKGTHLKFSKDGCMPVFTSYTPGDRRSTLNARAVLKRADRIAQECRA